MSIKATRACPLHKLPNEIIVDINAACRYSLDMDSDNEVTYESPATPDSAGAFLETSLSSQSVLLRSINVHS